MTYVYHLTIPCFNPIVHPTSSFSESNRNKTKRQTATAPSFSGSHSTSNPCHKSQRTDLLRLLDRQIAAADTILLNKSDLSPPSKLFEAERALTTINPTAPIQRSIRGAVDLATIIGLDAYASRPVVLGRSDSVADHEHHEGDGHDHTHTPGVTSIVLSLPQLAPSQISKVDEWIRTVLWENRFPSSLPAQHSLAEIKVEVLRCKGLYHTTENKAYILQGVQTLYDVQEVVHDANAGAGKLVLIGKGLGDRVQVEDNLLAFIALSEL